MMTEDDKKLLEGLVDMAKRIEGAIDTVEKQRFENMGGVLHFLRSDYLLIGAVTARYILLTAKETHY